MMRRIALVSLHCGVLALALMLASSQAGATPPPPMRYQNFHGASCQTTGSSDPHTYSSQGVFIPSTSTSTVALSCPVSWSLDATTSPLQAIQFSVTFAGAPTALASGLTPFDPGCTFLMNTNASLSGGYFAPPLTSIIGQGTSTPTFIYSWAAPLGVSLIFYENVIGSLLYCSSVPPGVTLNGYSVITCVSSSILNCAPM